MAGSGYHRLTQSEKQFFALLTSGLWNEVPDVSLFDGFPVDWEALYKLSFEQTVVGHVTDGINRLPERCLPMAEPERLDPFLGDTMSTEQRNQVLNRFIPNMFQALKPLPVLLIKGQGVGADYLEPQRRQPGDIDLLLMPEHYAAAKEILLAKATRVLDEMPEIYHQGMMFRSIEVEIHGAVSTLMSPAMDRHLARLQQECFKKGDFPTVEIGGASIPVPDVHFNALYIFMHFLHHYWSSGLGLRQLVDWTVFLSVHKRELDPEWLREQLEALGLLRVWKTFAGFAVEYLGCPAERLLLCGKPDPDRNYRIWKYVQRCGNFGKNENRSSWKKEPYLVRKLHSFWRLVLCDRLRHFRVFPWESVRIFLGAFRYGLGRLAKGD